MQKIIFYMSLFSEDIEAHLKNLRSKVTGNVESDGFIAIDLDDVD